MWFMPILGGGLVFLLRMFSQKQTIYAFLNGFIMDEQSNAFNIRNIGDLSNMPVVTTQVCFNLSYSDIQVQRKQRGRRGCVQ